MQPRSEIILVQGEVESNLLQLEMASADEGTDGSRAAHDTHNMKEPAPAGREANGMRGRGRALCESKRKEEKGNWGRKSKGGCFSAPSIASYPHGNNHSADVELSNRL